MNCNIWKAIVFASLAALVPAATGQQPAAESTTAAAEIEAASQAYVAAYNARDVDTLVSLWAPEGVYISRTSGEQIVGREAMKEEFAAILADDQTPTLAASIESVEFISPNVALERGTAVVTQSDDQVVETAYRVVYVKQEGAWLIDRITEDQVAHPTTHYQHLQDLEWLVGKWVDSGDGVTIEIDCKWTENRNYLSRTYTVSTDDGEDSSGLQIIGWDPTKEQIRSWLFDSSGGFIQGVWTARDDRWVVQSVATLADGAVGSFTSIFRPTEDGNYRWQKINRVIDGQILPSVDEVVVTRQ